MKISIIIPAYNEEKRIGDTLENYSEYFSKALKIKKLGDYEILVVINNTKDKTEEIVKTFQKRNSRINYLNLKQGGKGNAVLRGFEEILKKDFDLIGFVDADMATPAKEFFKLAENIGNSDGIIANRYLSGSKIHPPLSFRRLLVGKIFNYLVRMLFLLPYTDTQCGAKIFSVAASNEIVKTSIISNWAFDVDLLYNLYKKGYMIKQLSTEWYERDQGKLRVINATLEMVLAVVQLRIVNSRLKNLLRPLSPLIKRIWRKLK